MTEVVTQPGVLQALGINGTLFVAQLVNFGIVMFVVWKWVYKPLLKVMDARSKKIADGLSHAERAAHELAEAETRQAAVLKAARQEAQQMLEAARQDGEKQRQGMLAQAQADLERQLEEARARLKREKETMLTTIKREMADLVAAATEKVTSGGLHATEQRRLIEEAITDLDRTRV